MTKTAIEKLFWQDIADVKSGLFFAIEEEPDVVEKGKLLADGDEITQTSSKSNQCLLFSEATGTYRLGYFEKVTEKNELGDQAAAVTFFELDGSYLMVFCEIKGKVIDTVSDFKWALLN